LRGLTGVSESIHANTGIQINEPKLM